MGAHQTTPQRPSLHRRSGRQGGEGDFPALAFASCGTRVPRDFYATPAPGGDGIAGRNAAPARKFQSQRRQYRGDTGLPGTPLRCLRLAQRQALREGKPCAVSLCPARTERGGGNSGQIPATSAGRRGDDSAGRWNTVPAEAKVAPVSTCPRATRPRATTWLGETESQSYGGARP